MNVKKTDKKDVKKTDKRQVVMCICPVCGYEWGIFNPFFVGFGKNKKYKKRLFSKLKKWLKTCLWWYTDIDWEVYPHPATCTTCSGRGR